MKSTQRGSAGIGVLGILTILFVTLKLLEVGVVASWSWWLVLSPLLVGFGLTLLIFAGAIAVMALGS